MTGTELGLFRVKGERSKAVERVQRGGNMGVKREVGRSCDRASRQRVKGYYDAEQLIGKKNSRYKAKTKKKNSEWEGRTLIPHGACCWGSKKVTNSGFGGLLIVEGCG